MQTTWNKLTSPVRSLETGIHLTLFAVLALCLGAFAHAQSGIAVSGTPVQLGALTSGGWDGSQEPVGGTFVVGVNGDVLVGNGYGSNFLQITPAGTDTTLAAGVGGSAAALDKYGNLYFAGNYNANIYKVPYSASTGAYVGWTGSAPTTNCLGGNSDTSPCVFAPAVSAFMSGTLAGSGNSGYAGVAFDPQGNLFFESNTLPGTNPNSIYECNVACISNSSATPTLIYKDSNSIGALEIDPWGNIFFVDGNNSKGKVTSLNELPLSSGSYAASPTVVLSYTNAAGYGNGISGLAIAGNGTLYFSVNGDGLFAIPNTESGGPKINSMYMVSTQGGKGVAVDSVGNLYGIPYNNGDVVSFIPLGNFGLGTESAGTAATAVSATIIDSNGACTPTLTATATQFGITSTEFTATLGTSCSTPFSGSNGTFGAGPLTAAGFSSFPVTLNFTPVAAGKRTAALVVTDSTNSASGMAALNGVGQSAEANLDPGASTGITSGLTSPAAVVADPAGDLFIADSGAGKVYKVANGTTTLSPIGTGFTAPDALAFDANGDLFIADDGALDVQEIANTGTTGTFAAGTQTTVIAATAPFDGTPLGSATGLAVGPRGTLYISDPANNRVVYYNLVTGQSGVTLATAANGISAPAGLAVDASSNLYVADSSLNKVFIFMSAGGFSSVTPPGVGKVDGVAVDASGSLLVADGLSGAIVRIPNLGGTLTSASAITVETVSPQASSLWMDGQGDIYVASATGKAAYAIQRTAASVNLGTVQDGLTNSAAITLMNAGNAAATLGTPDVTQPANTMFMLAAAATNGCSSGGSGPAGASCQFTATFAPPVGTAAGPQTGSGSIDIATPALTLTVNLSGTASLSSVVAQTITGFNPPTTLEVGQQIALSATGGGSGNPVIFSIDALSPCPSCAATSGTNGATLTAIGAGTVIVDANQAGGQANGNQYAAATTVKKTIAITSPTPAGVPALIMSQVTWLNPTGSFTDGENPQGGSFAVTQNGEIVVGTTYSNKVYFVNAQTGATIGTPVSVSGPGGITIDSNNNLYISHLYNNVIYKIPFVKGAYVSWSDSPTPAPPACTGSDTAQCTFVTYPSSPAATGGQNSGLKAIAFDPSGNFYMVNEPSEAGSGASYIFECTTSCQPAGTGTLLYSDTNGISQIAFDPWGNLFFTDANYSVAGAYDGGNSGASSTSLNELVYTSGTGFASTATPLQTFTNNGGGGNYDDMLASVAVNPTTGTIYYGVLYDGMFAIPNTKTGGPQVADQFAISGQGAKALEPDTLGNLYMVANTSGADTVGFLAIDNLNAGPGPVLGIPVTATATVADNAIGCGTAATLAFASSNSQFSATGGTTCSSIGMGDAALLHSLNGTLNSASSYSATITFGPVNQGLQTATLSASDTTNGGTGTATVSGTGVAVPQTITFTAPLVTTFTYSPTLTIQLAATTTGASNSTTNQMQFAVASCVTPVSPATSCGAGTISTPVLSNGTWTATLTVTQAGSFTITASQPGGLVNNVYYEVSTQSLALIVNQAAQTIVFPQPLSPVSFATNPSTTVTLSANGGGSGNAVTFTVDASSTGAGTISSSTVANGTSTATLTVTGAGNIVVDANQAANVDYTAATQVQQTIVVNQASQSIAFTPLTQPFYYIVTGATLTIQATGGGSDNAIVFTVDSKSTMMGSFSSSKVSGAVSTAVLTLPANQSPTSGTIIVDANQPGNTNYQAATQAQYTISVGAPLPTQAITFPIPQTQVGGTTLALTATASSGFPVAYTSSTTSVCTVSGSTATFLKVSSASACTIIASQPGDNQYFAAAVPVSVTFAVNPAGMTPSMSLNLSLSSLTIEPGTVGLTQITINSNNNFAATQVTFACSGLPSGYSCSFNPSSVTAFAPNSTTGLPGGASATTTLTVTPPASAALVRHDLRPLFPVTFAVALFFMGFKKRNRLQLLLLLVVVFAGLGMISGCGGSSGSSTPPPVTSSATITASGGGTQVTSTLSVTVE